MLKLTMKYTSLSLYDVFSSIQLSFLFISLCCFRRRRRRRHHHRRCRRWCYCYWIFCHRATDL